MRPAGAPGRTCGSEKPRLKADRRLLGLVDQITASGAPGWLATTALFLEGDREDRRAPADGEAEGSRGLWLVDALSARWGYQRGGGLATTWFRSWLPSPIPAEQGRSWCPSWW